MVSKNDQSNLGILYSCHFLVASVTNSRVLYYKNRDRMAACRSVEVSFCCSHGNTPFAHGNTSK